MLEREWSVTGAVIPAGFQYAVIEVRCTAGPAERFVLAYSDERALTRNEGMGQARKTFGDTFAAKIPAWDEDIYRREWLSCLL